MVIKAGTHSPWVSRLLAECGHEVLVANPRKLALITENDRKDDPVDAELLGRVEPQLLSARPNRITTRVQIIRQWRRRSCCPRLQCSQNSETQR
jgi:hypothetical protein